MGPADDLPPKILAPYEKTREFLSGHFETSYKHELDHRDGLWRTLPVVVAAFGFYVTLMGFIIARTPRTPLNDVYWALMQSFSIVSATFGMAAFISAVRMLWYRTYEALPYETDTLAFVRSHMRQLEWHREQGVLDDHQCDVFALAQAQIFLIQEQAQIAANNRVINETRYLARGKCITYLCVAYVFLIVPAVTLSWYKPALPAAQNDTARDNTPNVRTTASSTAARKAATGNHPGR